MTTDTEGKKDRQIKWLEEENTRLYSKLSKFRSKRKVTMQVFVEVEFEVGDLWPASLEPDDLTDHDIENALASMEGREFGFLANRVRKFSGSGIKNKEVVITLHDPEDED